MTPTPLKSAQGKPKTPAQKGGGTPKAMSGVMQNIRPDALERLRELVGTMDAKAAQALPALARGHRFISLTLDVELVDFLEQEVERLNGLASAGRIGAKTSTHKLVLEALEQRLPSLAHYSTILGTVQSRRRALGHIALSVRCPNHVYADLSHLTLATRGLTVKGLCEALVYAWATALKEETRFIPGGSIHAASHHPSGHGSRSLVPGGAGDGHPKARKSSPSGRTKG